LLCGRIIFRPHRSTTYVDAACCYRSSSVVCRSVGLSVTVVSPAKMAEPIEMPFGMRTRVGPRKYVGLLGGDEHWRHMANAIEPSIMVHVRRWCNLLSNYFDQPNHVVSKNRQPSFTPYGNRPTSFPSSD